MAKGRKSSIKLLAFAIVGWLAVFIAILSVFYRLPHEVHPRKDPVLDLRGKTLDNVGLAIIDRPVAPVATTPTPTLRATTPLPTVRGTAADTSDAAPKHDAPSTLAPSVAKEAPSIHADAEYRTFADGWEGADESCRAEGLRLCSLDEYCPVDHGTPLRGRVQGDWFAAIGDVEGDFVSIGTEYPDRLCGTHSECCGGRPLWGQTAGKEFKGLCCGDTADAIAAATKTKKAKEGKGPAAEVAAPPEPTKFEATNSDAAKDEAAVTDALAVIADESYRTSGATSWQAVSQECVSAKLRLCTLQEYCPRGRGSEPAMGSIEGDWFGPVADRPGEFVALGTQFPDHLCGTHSDCCGKVPDLSKDPSMFMQTLCCRGEPPVVANAPETSSADGGAGGGDGPSVAPPVGSGAVDAEYWSSMEGYDAAVEKCTREGKGLCNLAEYCPDGPGKPPLRGIVSGDWFGPIGDARGEYVSLGNEFMDRLCKTHTECCNTVPGWGQQYGRESKALCCERKAAKKTRRGKGRGGKGGMSRTDTIADRVYSDVAKTWTESDKACRDAGKRLCSLAEYCPRGKGALPLRGAADGDWFAPIADQQGEYVSIGTSFPDRLCGTHTECCGQAPVWGEDRDAGPSRKYLCCRGKAGEANSGGGAFEGNPANADDEYRTAVLGYDKAVEDCNIDGMRLCKLDEYCPDGKDGTPFRGVLRGDWWAPVADKHGEYVAIGTFDMNRLCGTHTECCGSPPIWGNQKTHIGKSLCCGEVDKALAERTQKLVAADQAPPFRYDPSLGGPPANMLHDYNAVLEHMKYYKRRKLRGAERQALRESFPVTDKFLSHEMDHGGFNNIRQAYEISILLAVILGRTWVVPPPTKWYLIDFGPMGKQQDVNGRKYDMNFGTVSFFSDFFDLVDLCAPVEDYDYNEEDSEDTDASPLRCMTSREFRKTSVGREMPRDGKRFAKSGRPQARWEDTTTAYHTWEQFLRRTAPDRCVVHNPLKEYLAWPSTRAIKLMESRWSAGWLSGRQAVQVSDEANEAPLLHLACEESREQRYLGQLASMVAFESLADEKLVRRFFHDRVHYLPETFALAARVVAWLGLFQYSAMHLRRNDLQYKEVFISLDKIARNIEMLMLPGEAMYVATDIPASPGALDKLAISGRTIYRWDDFFTEKGGYVLNDLPDGLVISDKTLGQVEQLICASARLFVGTALSTFSGYVPRLRGYLGAPDTHYYVNTQRYYGPDTEDDPVEGVNFFREFAPIWDL